MRIIDRYILFSIAKVFIAAVFIFCFMYILIDTTSNLDEIIDRKVPFPILLQYYSLFLPVILTQTSSIACLISVLLTYSNLHTHNEVIALRASGLNFWQITKPALFFSLLVSMAVFLVNERLVPAANHMTKQIENEYMVLEADRYRETHEKITNLTFYGLKNRLFYIESLNPKTNELAGITIIENDENQNVREKVVALKGVWTGIAWKFLQTHVTEYDSDGLNAPVKLKVYDEKLMDIKETPEDFIRQRVNVDAMNIRDLYDYIGRFANSGATKAINSLRVDFHQKIAYPIGNFVIVLAGLPFALLIKSRKGMTFTSLGLAVLVGFLYYVLNAVAIAFGKGGWLSPLLAAWAAPILFVAVALFIIETKF